MISDSITRNQPLDAGPAGLLRGADGVRQHHDDNVVGSTPELHNRGPPDPFIACTPHYFDIQAQPPLANITVANISYVNSPPTP